MSGSNTTNSLLVAIVIMLSVAALYFARPVVIVLLLTVLLVYTLDPMVVFLQRRRIRFWLATVIAIAFFALLFLGIFVLILRDLAQFGRAFPRFQQEITVRAEKALESFETSLGISFPVNPLEELRNLPIGSLGLAFVRSALRILSEFLLIFFFSIILLVGKYRVIRKILTVFPRRHSPVPIILRHVDRHLRGFLGIKTLSSLAIGTGTAAILLGFRVEFAVTWGLLGALANFVPTLGPIVAILMPVLITTIQFTGPLRTLEVGLCLVAVHLLVSNIAEPRFMGERLDLSFFSIFVSLFFWGWMWGAPGILLAVPVTASLKIILERIPATARMALLLGRNRRRAKRDASG